jgi:hypothetical protein
VPEKNKEMRPALYFISEGLILKKKESFICDCSIITDGNKRDI